MALVITRKQGERLTIGDNIIVTVTAIRGNRVKLMIEAPRSLVVSREETRRISDTWKAEDAARDGGIA